MPPCADPRGAPIFKLESTPFTLLQLPAVVQPAAAAPAQPSVPEGAQQGGDAATAAYYAQYYQQYYQQFYTQEVTEAKA